MQNKHTLPHTSHILPPARMNTKPVEVLGYRYTNMLPALLTFSIQMAEYSSPWADL